MPSLQQKFWKLAIDSRLLALEECQQLHTEFAQVCRAPPDDVNSLARWLVSQGVLSRYQARVLLAGKAGPFWIGDYKIIDRYGDGQIKGIYQAVNQADGQEVLLLVVPLAAGQDLAKLTAAARKIQKAVAASVSTLKREIPFSVHGQLTYAVLAEISPPPEEVVPPEAPDPEPPAQEWMAEMPASRPRRSRRRILPMLVGWGVPLALIAGAGIIWQKLEPVGGAGGGTPNHPPENVAIDSESAKPASDSPPVTSEDQVALEVRRATGDEEPGTELIDDDGQTLWASPTSGAPIELAYLPPGFQAVLVLRPAEFLTGSEGTKLLEAIGPAGASATEAIHAITGCTWEDMEQLEIAFYPSDAEPRPETRSSSDHGLLVKRSGPSYSPWPLFVVRLAPSLSAEAWADRLPKREPAQHAGKHYSKSADGWAYYQPETGGRSIVVGTPWQIEEAIDSSGPAASKAIERVLADTDTERHFTLLAEPFSVLEGDRALFVGELSRLAEPLRRFLGDRVQAVAFSGHVGRELFLELRAYGEADIDPRHLATHYRAELSALPEQFAAYLATLQPQPYGQAVLQRFPKMLDQLQQFTRAGAEHHQALLRCYLPPAAGQNLLLGSELALAETPKSASKEGKGPGKKGVDPATALAKKISISFPRDTLEKSIEMVSTEIGVEIDILGTDLQLEGITKNQSFALDERDQPAGEILLKILKLANPGGKLIYVIKPKAPGGEPILFITTRASAKKRGDTLPTELETK
ncbi:MAG TPA: hypothetical protein VMF30_10110 [Pirellulales bacterium]|nr:hypothetical protein [Pirellulales bacterium]